ncbi:hypothetical protein [Nocardia sp. alder85J]|uniref:hypothetical protein n=1 Tax=Nocardia sp. alder85J TaxID=2862949 RepID=UPI001CD19BD2|nr:hypothetical protein [Nocardia sp. alder85J]MCX4097750.1 hypothetical protein [Nocardia sp. alder85J]
MSILPGWHDLIAAMQGRTAASDTDVITWCAAELGLLYRCTPPGGRSGAQRGVLMTAIDMFAATQVRWPGGGGPAQPLGALVDEMAATSALATTALRVCKPSSEFVHRCWLHLATLAEAWTLLSLDATTGRYEDSLAASGPGPARPDAVTSDP